MSNRSRRVALAALLASLVAPKINDKKTESLKAEARLLLKDSRSLDAVQGPAKMLPEGGWSRSRRGGSPRRDGGSRRRLIG